MINLLLSIFSQSLTFLPLALGISISYHLLRATDMTIDGSFVLGAAVFARLITLGCSPYFACIIAITSGAFAGILSAVMQRHGRIEPLLAGILATFILSSLNLIIMDKPNISLLNQTTLFSALQTNEVAILGAIFLFILFICGSACAFLTSNKGLTLRALGDNPTLLQRLGKNVEHYRMLGFALTNMLAASAGCLTAQIIGYADVGMGFGMTLTGIGAIILGQQLFLKIKNRSYFRIGSEFFACLLGVIIYFSLINTLLRFDINPLYLKMLLGILLALFLRSAIKSKTLGAA